MPILHTYLNKMNKFLLLFGFLVFPFFAQAQNAFELKQRDNTNYITHRVKPGESLYQLARDYSVKAPALLKFNQLGTQTTLKAQQEIDIPLTETNFFKMAGLGSVAGFSPVVYAMHADESRQDVLKQFKVSEATFDQWNANQENTAQVIVGWLKYESNTNNASFASNETTEPTPKEELIEPIAESPIEEDVIVEDVVETKPSTPIRTESNTPKKDASNLNPRYIDPNAPRPAVAKNNAYANRYAYKSPAVKKEVQSVKDDSQDFWVKLKGIFSSKKNKSKGKQIEEPKKEEIVASKTKTTEMPKPQPKVQTKPQPKPLPKSNPIATKSTTPKSKPTEVPKPTVFANATNKSSTEEKNKAKHVWKDFKSSFKSDKNQNANFVKSELAAPKPVKGDPNKNFGDKPTKKSKVVWEDLKGSFKADKPLDPKDRFKAASAARTSSQSETVKPQAASKPVPKPVQLETPKPKEIIAQTAEEKPKKSNGKGFWNKLVNGDDKPATVRTNEPKNIVPKQTGKKTNTLNTPKKEEPKVIVMEDPKKEVSEPVAVRSEIKSLSLNNSKAGKASYFFSGPSGGKFYVATNLASKGEIVKVINPDNGKYVMAEVLSSLPSSDAAKGIILKLSDNAKLPLGQKNSSFAVKVNY
jgi:hypothetical protein